MAWLPRKRSRLRNNFGDGPALQLIVEYSIFRAIRGWLFDCHLFSINNNEAHRYGFLWWISWPCGLALWGTSWLNESLLIAPQIIQICKVRRVGGISYSLLLLNLMGDIVKMIYFVINVRWLIYRINPSNLNFAASFKYFLILLSFSRLPTMNTRRDSLKLNKNKGTSNPTKINLR